MNFSKLRLIAGGLFSAIGLSMLVLARDVLGAAIWLSFGNGLLLSDPRLLRRGLPPHATPQLPKARRFASYFLLGLAVLLLIFQVYQDQVKIPEPQATEPAKQESVQ